MESSSSSTTGPAIPEGFKVRHLGDGFMDVNGPLYYRRAPGTDRLRGVSLGFRVEMRHCNPLKACHGGMLATFTDMLFAVTAHATCEAGRHRFLPTISLQLDYLAGAPLGSWLQGDAQVLRATRNMIFLQGLLSADGVPVVRASGIFKIGPEFRSATAAPPVDPVRVRLSPPSFSAMPPHSPWIDLITLAVESAATLAFAVSGLLEAARKRLDPVGVCIAAGLAAFGGGTLRDVLLDRRPFFWVEHSGWLWALLALCGVAMLWMKSHHGVLTSRAMQWADALGLGLFSASGTELALAQGLPAIVAVLMGVITAAFGGVLRDVFCNEIPRAFADHQPYAVCAFAGGWVLVGLHALALPQGTALLGAAAVAFGLRAVALHFDLRLPGWVGGRDEAD